ncbi:MAG: AMP-binding protein, partial [Rhodobacteraceae bacterium]|nr:AMP-binding protein [Paracoccaceae bacterium]
MNNSLYYELFGIHAGKKTPFLIRPDGTIITYEKFLQLGIQFAHVLTDLGVSSGDRLLVHVEKSPEVLALYAACIQTGIVFVPLNPAYTIDELSYFIADSQPSLVVCDASNLYLISPLAVARGIKRETLNQDGTGSLVEKAYDKPHDFPTVSRARDDLATILYTSGTTGQPKGAMLTQENLLSNGRVLRDLWQFDTSDVLLH